MNHRLQHLLESIEEKRVFSPKGEERIANVLMNRPVDYLPLLFWRPQNTTTPGKTYHLKEQFYSKEKMLYGQLEEVLISVENAFDAPLCIRPNFGTIFIPAMFGLTYQVTANTYPWITNHLTKEEIKGISLKDPLSSPMMERAIEYMEYFLETVPEWIHIYLPDTQGPFDLAHLLYGTDIFYEIYDDSPFVHYLLDLTTEIFIQVTERLKEIVGEERDSCYHGHALTRGIYMKNGGTRVSEDSATLLSPEQIDTFVLPYVEKALSHFGGGFIHFCGKNDYLLESFLRLKGVRAINLGNPELYDFSHTMKRFLEENTIYFGLWPKEEEEDLGHYIQRMKEATKRGTRGLLLHFQEEMFPSYPCASILKVWIEGE